MRRYHYHLSNGFHGTTTHVIVGEGQVLPGATMRAAYRRLCPTAQCTCMGSMASNPRDDQLSGIPTRPDLTLVLANYLPGYSSDDLDDHKLVTLAHADALL